MKEKVEKYENFCIFNWLKNRLTTFITLKDYLLYSKSYIKIDVLEKIVKTFNSDKSFFIVFCEKECS